MCLSRDKSGQPTRSDHRPDCSIGRLASSLMSAMHPQVCIRLYTVAQWVAALLWLSSLALIVEFIGEANMMTSDILCKIGYITAIFMRFRRRVGYVSVD